MPVVLFLVGRGSFDGSTTPYYVQLQEGGGWVGRLGVPDVQAHRGRFDVAPQTYFPASFLNNPPICQSGRRKCGRRPLARIVECAPEFYLSGSPWPVAPADRPQQSTVVQWHAP